MGEPLLDTDSVTESLVNGEATTQEIDMCNRNGPSSPQVAVEPEPGHEENGTEAEPMNLDDSEAQNPTPENGAPISPTFSEPEVAIAIDDDETPVEPPKPKKRGKNYPPPLVPSSLPPRIIPVTDNFTSDEDEPPHSNIPLSQRRKNGYCTTKTSSSIRRKKTAAALKRGTKHDRDILNDIENPKPSTSAALVREMTRILNGVKDGRLSSGSSRSRESLSSRSSSVDRSDTPKGVQKRPTPTRNLAMAQPSAKKKLNLPSQKKKSVSKGGRSAEAQVFEFLSEEEAEVEARPTPLKKKRANAKRSAPALALSSSDDDEAKKSVELMPKVNGNGASISRNGKRKTEETDSAERNHRGAKKMKASNPSVNPEFKPEPKQSAENGHVNAASMPEPEPEVDSAVTPLIPIPVDVDTESEPKPKRRGRKPKKAAIAIVKSTELANGNSSESKDSSPAAPAQTEATATNGDAEPVCSEPESAPINAPVITISGRALAPSRRSVRERRPRQIDNAWIY